MCVALRQRLTDQHAASARLRRELLHLDRAHAQLKGLQHLSVHLLTSELRHAERTIQQMRQFIQDDHGAKRCTVHMDQEDYITQRRQSSQSQTTQHNATCYGVDQPCGGRKHLGWAGPECPGACCTSALSAGSQHDAASMVRIQTLCSELLVAETWVGKWAIERRMRLATEQLQDDLTCEVSQLDVDLRAAFEQQQESSNALSAVMDSASGVEGDLVSLFSDLRALLGDDAAEHAASRCALSGEGSSPSTRQKWAEMLIRRQACTHLVMRSALEDADAEIDARGDALCRPTAGGAAAGPAVFGAAGDAAGVSLRAAFGAAADRWEETSGSKRAAGRACTAQHRLDGGGVLCAQRGASDGEQTTSRSLARAARLRAAQSSSLENVSQACLGKPDVLALLETQSRALESESSRLESLVTRERSATSVGSNSGGEAAARSLQAVCARLQDVVVSLASDVSVSARASSIDACTWQEHARLLETHASAVNASLDEARRVLADALPLTQEAAMREGQARGMSMGEAFGREQGFRLGREEGFVIGREDGLLRGRKEGNAEARRAGERDTAVAVAAAVQSAKEAAEQGLREALRRAGDDATMLERRLRNEAVTAAAALEAAKGKCESLLRDIEGLRTELSSIRADRDAARQKCIELAELCNTVTKREEQAAAKAEAKVKAAAAAEMAEAVAAAKANAEALMAVAVAKAAADGEAAVQSAVAAATKDAERRQQDSLEAANAAAAFVADEARAEAAAQTAELSRLRRVERECVTITEQHAGLRDQYRKLQADHRVLFASVSQASDSAGARAASANGRFDHAASQNGHAVTAAADKQKDAEERAAAAAANAAAAIAAAAPAAERERTRELHAQLESAAQSLKQMRQEGAASRVETEALKRQLASVIAERQSESHALREALQEKANQAEESHAEVAALRLDLAAAQEQANRFKQEAVAATGQKTPSRSDVRESSGGRERESEAAAAEVERAVGAAVSRAARDGQRSCDDAVDMERARAATRAVTATAERTALNVLKREVAELEKALLETGQYAGSVPEADDVQLLRLASIEDSWPVPVR